MTSATKQIGEQAMKDLLLFRKSNGKKSVKRMETQSVAEAAVGWQTIVFDLTELKAIAQAVGGTYITGTGGNSKFVF